MSIHSLPAPCVIAASLCQGQEPRGWALPNPFQRSTSRQLLSPDRKERKMKAEGTEAKDSPFTPCYEESWHSYPRTSLRSGKVVFGRACFVTDLQSDLGQGISSYCISAPQLLSRDDTASLSHRSGLKVCEAFKHHSLGSHKNSLSRQIHHAQCFFLLSPQHSSTDFNPFTLSWGT